MAIFHTESKGIAKTLKILANVKWFWFPIFFLINNALTLSYFQKLQLLTLDCTIHRSCSWWIQLLNLHKLIRALNTTGFGKILTLSTYGGICTSWKDFLSWNTVFWRSIFFFNSITIGITNDDQFRCWLPHWKMDLTGFIQLYKHIEGLIHRKIM